MTQAPYLYQMPTRTAAAKMPSNVTEFPTVQTSRIKEAFEWLQQRGFNVFTVRPNEKRGFAGWDIFKTTHLPDLATIERLEDKGRASIFKDRSGLACNLAVMCGHTSGNLVVLDCETLKAATQIRTELTTRRIVHWEVKTGRGAHFWLRTNVEALNGVATIPDVEIRGHGVYVMAPGSVHPSGAIYEMVTKSDHLPVVNIGQLAWAGVQPNRPSRGDRENTRDALYTLQNGAADGERNTALSHAAYWMHGVGYSDSEARRAILDAAGKCTPAYPEKEALAIVKSVFQGKSDKTPETSPSLLSKALHFADQHQWDSKTALIDRDVFKACILRYSRGNEKGAFRATCREIAEIAGIQKNTAGKALKRLVDMGILERAGNSQSQDKSGVYQFGGLVRKRYTSYEVATTSRTSVSNPNQSKHDAFHRRALGKSGQAIYSHLETEPLPNHYPTIAQRTGLNLSSVKRAMPKLLASGLVAVDATNHLCVVDNPDFAAVAEMMGTAGYADKRHEAHDQQRRLRAYDKLRGAIHGRPRKAAQTPPALHVDAETGEIVDTPETLSRDSGEPIQGNAPSVNTTLHKNKPELVIREIYSPAKKGTMYQVDHPQLGLMCSSDKQTWRKLGDTKQWTWQEINEM